MTSTGAVFCGLRTTLARACGSWTAFAFGTRWCTMLSTRLRRAYARLRGVALRSLAPRVCKPDRAPGAAELRGAVRGAAHHRAAARRHAAPATHRRRAAG